MVLKWAMIILIQFVIKIRARKQTYKENLRLKKILKKRILEIKGIFLQNYTFPDFAFQIIIIYIKSRLNVNVFKILMYSRTTDKNINLN